MKKIHLILILISIGNISIAQNYGDFQKIEKQKLLNDLELIYQGLDKYHSGMYWYTTQEEFDSTYSAAKAKLDRDMNVLDFYKVATPLFSLSREGHAGIRLSDSMYRKLNKEYKFLPLAVVFLDEKLYCSFNGSNKDSLQSMEIELINGEKPLKIAKKLGQYLTSDGYIESVKRHYLRGLGFSKKYFYYYGEIKNFEIKFKGKEKPVIIDALSYEEIKSNLKKRRTTKTIQQKKELLEFKILNDSTVYLGIHSFSNDDIKEKYGKPILRSFLKNSFQSIEEKRIKHLIIDVSRNGGGTEGNGSLLYSYIGENFQKYKKVKAKTNKVVLDNGTDKPIKFKTFGILERIFVNRKMKNNSYERKNWPGLGLMAFKKEPNHKFKGSTYVIIGPRTYSGGSEFANLMYSETKAIFVGRETGGGYYGNTSGYGRRVVLPNTQIILNIPALQFEMNVKPTLPFGSGVIPHYKVIPTIEQALDKRNMPIEFVLNKIAENK